MARRTLIADTEATVLAVWAQAALGYVPPEIEHACATQSFTDYLLLAPDLPWQADPLRSAPELAQRQAILCNTKLGWRATGARTRWSAATAQPFAQRVACVVSIDCA